MDNINDSLSELDKQIGSILHSLFAKYIWLIIIGMIIISILIILISYKEYKNAVKEKRKEILLKEYIFQY